MCAPPFPRILRNDHLFVVGQQGDKWICGSQFQGTKVSIGYCAIHFRACLCENLSPYLHRFELGAAVFVGWGGSLLLISGGMVLAYFSGKEGLKSRWRQHLLTFHLGCPRFPDMLFISDTALDLGNQPPTPPPGPGGPTCCQPRRPGWPWGRRSFTREGRAGQPEQRGPTKRSAGTALYNA